MTISEAPNCGISYDRLLRLSLTIVTYDRHLWSSLTIITYDHYSFIIQATDDTWWYQQYLTVFCLSGIVTVLILAILTRPSMLSSYDKGANKLEKKFYKICSRFFPNCVCLRFPCGWLLWLLLPKKLKTCDTFWSKKIFFWAEKKCWKIDKRLLHSAKVRILLELVIKWSH
jgi:hypothetical protein